MLAIVDAVLKVLAQLLPFFFAYKFGKDSVEKKLLTGEVNDVKKAIAVKNSTSGLTDAELDKWLQDHRG